MQTYLKSKPVFIQFLFFVGIVMGTLTVVFLIGSLILSKITGMSLMEMSNTRGWQPGDARTLGTLRGMLLLQFLGLFLIPSLLFAYFADAQPLRYLGLRRPHSAVYWILGIAALLLAVPMVEYTGYLNKNLPFNTGTRQWMESMEGEAAKTIQYLLANNTLSNLLMNLVFIALFAGVGEELLFRGVIQRLTTQASRNPWVGIVLAAFLFSFFHLQFYGFIPRFLLGIVLGAIYWYSGSIWPAIVAHFVYDAFYLTLAYLQPQLATDPNASVTPPEMLPYLGLLSAAVVAGLVWVMRKKSNTTYENMYEEDLALQNTTDGTK